MFVSLDSVIHLLVCLDLNYSPPKVNQKPLLFRNSVTFLSHIRDKHIKFFDVYAYDSDIFCIFTFTCEIDSSLTGGQEFTS
jgi:hypothetical protein